jgi:hypothetical protein
MTANDLENLLIQTELQMINVSYPFMDNLMAEFPLSNDDKRNKLAKKLNDEKWILTVGMTRDDYKEHIEKVWVKNEVH